jgi:aryl-alcohol dehydrogenase-like predicted oxidoreductase
MEISEMSQKSENRLMLGGHSFIKQLGNDPLACENEQQSIVESCLNHGIGWFDTTYQPERIALGKALRALGRRAEATIFAWNFFTTFSSNDSVGEAEYYRPEHLKIILNELGTDYVDCLVMVPLSDPEENRRQEELLMQWQAEGYVNALGLWISDPRLVEQYRHQNPFRFAIRQFNITTSDGPQIFAACKTLGWETLAASPFMRGWELEMRVVQASIRRHTDAESLRPIVADLMLRFSLFQRDVDRVIVAMRKAAWIGCNVTSASKGPLTANELRWLEGLGEPASSSWL